MNPYEEFTKEICPNCKGICHKGIVVTEYPDMTVAQCPDYISDGNVKGYKEYKRTAKQNKPLMKGFI